MRIKLASLAICFLSIYLLGLNVISLQHSFEHHTKQKFPALHLDDTLSVASADSSDLLCELCDFFQNQVFYFPQEKAASFISFSNLLPIEKRATITLIELFNQSLRGPPALG